MAVAGAVGNFCIGERGRQEPWWLPGTVALSGRMGRGADPRGNVERKQPPPPLTLSFFFFFSFSRARRTRTEASVEARGREEERKGKEDKETGSRCGAKTRKRGKRTVERC